MRFSTKVFMFCYILELICILTIVACHIMHKSTLLLSTLFLLSIAIQVYIIRLILGDDNEQ